MTIVRSARVKPGSAKRPATSAAQVRTKWEVLDGRRVRLWLLPPQSDVWHDSTTHPPLFLLHGLGCAADAWGPTLQHLAEHRLDRPVYAVDMPGFGHSKGPHRALSVAELADWVGRLMDLLGILHAHLGGNSLGAQVALAVSRLHPERAASLVLAGAVTGGDLVSLPSMALGLVRDGLTEPGLYDGSLPRMYAQTGPRRFLQTMGEMRRDHPVLQARAVSAPCLIVRGTRDTAAPEPAVRALAAALPHGSYQAIEGSPHAVQYAAPEAFTRLAVAFCARVEDKGRISCRIHSDTGIRAGSFGTTSNRLRIDGHPVHYEMVSAAPLLGGDSGQNTLLPLLLLHGLAGSGEVWERFLPLLDQSLLPRPVYVPDLPGFGRSGGPRRTLGIHELADWCARFLDAVQVERADVAAHSMGCQVALALARRHPERVGRLVLVGPTTGSRSVPAWRYLTGMAVGSSREPLLYRFLAARMFWRMGIRRYVETVREMMRDDALAGASGVTAESLVIWGDRDTIVPESAARSLAKTLPGGSYQVVAKAAHVVPFNSAGAFAPLAHAFWQQQRKSD